MNSWEVYQTIEIKGFPSSSLFKMNENPENIKERKRSNWTFALTIWGAKSLDFQYVGIKGERFDVKFGTKLNVYKYKPISILKGYEIITSLFFLLIKNLSYEVHVRGLSPTNSLCNALSLR